jgi:eukaryotic-like serine/threonine-protein kinase
MAAPIGIDMIGDNASTRQDTAPLGTLPDLGKPNSDRPGGPLPAIAGFEILGELGRGGVGVVFKARQTALNRLVAIKMLSGHVQSHPEVLARFRTEAQAFARLQHPNIVQVFEVGEAGGRPFLALEFVPGGTLAQFLGRQPQPIPLAVELTCALALATEHAHEQGILHRDLKPGNVLLNKIDSENPAGRTASSQDTLRIGDPKTPIIPKITDFGLAKQVDASDGPTEMGAVIGTPSYMAPEQASGVTRTFTPAVDVYALGAILYEMLTGRPPFLGESPTQTILQVLSQEPVPPRELRPDCPRDLETIALKCLQKNPARRYAAARDLAEDLRRFQAGEPIRARPAGPVERLLKWAKRRPTAAAALVAGMVLLVVTALYAIEQHNHGIELRDLADQERRARERSEANFQLARKAVKELLADVGANDLASVPQMDPVRRSLLQKAMTSMHELLRQNRSNPSVMHQMAQIQFDTGELYELLGDNGQALDCYRGAAQIYEGLCKSGKPNSALVRERVLTLKGLATVLQDLGQQDEAAAVFQEGLAVADELNAKWPDDAENTHVRSRLLLNRGQLLSHSNHLAEGSKDIERARDDLLKLAGQYPDRREFKESLATAFNNLGVNLRATKHLDAAANCYQEAVTIYRDLAEHYADNRQYRYQLTIAARNLGTANWWLEKNDESISAFNTAIAECRKLLNDYPGIPTYQVNLALALVGLGELLAYADKPEGLERLREAVAILEKLVAEQPKLANFQYQLGFAMTRVGFAHMKGKNWLEALRWEELALKRFRAALALNPKDERFQFAIQEGLKRHARSFLELNQISDAAKTVAELVEIVPKDGDELFEAACLLAQCSAKSKDETASKFGGRAVELLRQAAAAKSLNETTLRNTPELDSLRSRPDFQALAKQLHKPK